jgi:hypothetical protein
VKQSRTRDEIVELGTIVARGGRPRVRRRRTTALAQQRANRLATELGRYPAVEGKISFAADTLIRRAHGGPLAAYMIRGGDTIAVTDLPKTDLFQQGRDGETLFHVVSSEVDLEAATVQLDVEGQTSRSDIILARLAAFSRQ